ncbi:MAG: hypothetical protein PHQ62_00035 [Clostridia bacterium]|nr:hypothetical protein [Clostridia bacterium]
MIDKNELQNIKKMKEVNILSHINSLKGEMDKAILMAECEYQNQHIYIVKYNNKFCTAIFNCFVFEYYTDDVYGVINEFEIA